MKKRILALLLIGALLASTACGKENADEFGVSGNHLGGIGTQSGKLPSGQEQQQNNEENSNPNQGNGSADQGGQTANGNSSANQGGETAGGNATGGPVSLGQTYGAGEAVEMKKGETIWFGPASKEQADGLTFNGAKAAPQKAEEIGGGFYIWSYTASADGKATPAVGETFKDVFLVAKSQMTALAYFGQWDNQKNRNIYDLRFDKSGKWIDASGALQKGGEGNATHAIPVSKGESLTFGPVRAGQPVLGYAYDASGNPVSMINGYGLKTCFTFPQGMVCYTYTVPEGIASVRLNVAEGEKELFAIMKNEFTSDQYQRLTGQKAADAEDPLFKKKCLFIGDSICAAGADSGSLKGWARRVQEATGAECYNEGVSGAALSDCRLGRPGATVNSQIYNQLNIHKNKDFDYVLIHGGVNDAWDSKPIGSVSRGYDPAGFDLSTYAGGLEMTIYTAIENFGDTAAIGYLMNFQLPQCPHGFVAQKMGDYFAVGKEICEKWGISYFDMFNDSKINNQMQVTGNKYLPDGVHPNEGGYDILGPYITKYMKTMTATTQKILEELASQ